MSYSFLEHTADVKVSAEGKDFAELFSSCVNALNEVIRGEITILDSDEKSVRVEGKSHEEVLYRFLEEVLVLLDSDDFLVSKAVKISYDENSYVLKAQFFGDKAENYSFTNDVKAVTYSEMRVFEEDGLKKAVFVLDV